MSAPDVAKNPVPKGFIPFDSERGRKAAAKSAEVRREAKAARERDQATLKRIKAALSESTASLGDLAAMTAREILEGILLQRIAITPTSAASLLKACWEINRVEAQMPTVESKDRGQLLDEIQETLALLQQARDPDPSPSEGSCAA